MLAWLRKDSSLIDLPKSVMPAVAKRIKAMIHLENGENDKALAIYNQNHETQDTTIALGEEVKQINHNVSSILEQKK